MALAAASLATASCGGEQSRVPSGQPIAVTAAQLAGAYEESERAAQREYGNRRLLVTGTVTRVTVDFQDNPVLRMQGLPGLTDVHLTLAEEAKAQADDVKPSAQMTLACEGATLVIGSPTLDGCTFAGKDGA
jgi:hypothetical protein